MLGGKKILELLARDGQVRVSQLSEALGATVVTIRNDLATLERDGYCERIAGGALQTVKNFYNMDFQLRKQENMDDKKAIALAVADLVQDGETLLINSGTTTYYAAIELKQHKNLSIVTNSFSVAIELGSHPTFRVIMLGGGINSQYAFTYGNDAIAQLRKYKARQGDPRRRRRILQDRPHHVSRRGIRDQPGHDGARPPDDHSRRPHEIRARELLQLRGDHERALLRHERMRGRGAAEKDRGVRSQSHQVLKRR